MSWDPSFFDRISAICNVLGACAYLSILGTLWLLWQKARLRFSGLALAFGGFLVLISLGRLGGAFNYWEANPGMRAMISALTTLAAALTAVYLIPNFQKLVQTAERARELEKAERRIRKEKDFVATLIRESADGIFAFDTDGRYTVWNRAMERMTGQPHETVIGNLALESFPHLLEKGIYDHYLKALGGRTSQIDGKEYVHAMTGLKSWYDAVFSPIWDEDHCVLGGLCVVRDVSERKLRDELVQSQQEKLVHASRMKVLGEMAAGIAHEINTPVTTIILKANELKSLAARSPELSDQILPIASKVSQTSQRIGEIVRGLKAFAREPGDEPFSLARVRSIIQETLALCESRFKSHAISIELDHPETEIDLECRPVQIIQVLLNLMNNSYDALSALDEGRIVLRVSDHGKMVQIQVLDDGPGIPSHFLPKLMQPFATTKEQGKGTGLGLSISKGIVESHRGSLVHDPREEQTSFSIWLPKRQGQEPDNGLRM
jgi:PAS domain S-box-containing protein